MKEREATALVLIQELVVLIEDCAKSLGKAVGDENVRAVRHYASRLDGLMEGLKQCRKYL